MPDLFSKMAVKDKLLLKNRVVMAPMTTWASNSDYTISDQEVTYYQARNQGVGMVITGCTPVQEDGIGFRREFAAYDDSFISSLEKLAAAVKSNGAKAILQIFHAGNKALPDLSTAVVSASPVPARPSSATPKELTEAEIQAIIKAFGETTQRAIAAGFDGVEIHGAHGFLVQSFLSPFFNRRTDQWGGSFDNRLRFPLAVVKEIQAVIAASKRKDFILGYRLSPEESIDGGLRVEDTLALTDALIDLGIDYIHTSLFVPQDTQPQGYNQTYAELFSERIAKRTLLIYAGGVQSPDQAAALLEQGVDGVAVGHALITDPDWVRKAEAGQADDIRLTLQKSQVSDLSLPDYLWEEIQASGLGFTVTD